MLETLFHSQLALGAAECASAGLLALLVMLLASRRGLNLKRELPLAELRGMVQIVLVGLLLAAMLHGPGWTSLFALAAMMLAAASITQKRAHRYPRAFSLALISIFAGAGSVLALMVSLGVIPLRISMLVPVGSMILANTMNTLSLFLERLRGEIAAHTGEVESALALGASPDAAILPYLKTAFRASMIPSVDSIRSLGIVWIPGIMAGMVLSGASPVYAALYQFVVLTTVFSSSALACLAASYLVGARIFTPQEQLALRG